jgi:pimeloyl-ACP methyl ester carboxylesterase
MPIIKANGIDLYYEEKGDKNKPPLLLIMGITAPGSVWYAHAEEWEKEFRCIIVDNRGVGQSDKPKGPYSTEQMADDYASLLEHLSLEDVLVAGVSMGGTIALQLAIRHPKKVKSLVLMCPWARCDNKAKAIFQHMMKCKARFRPEEFSHYIQLLIYSKASWDNPLIYNELEEGRAADAIGDMQQPLHGLEGQAWACINHNVLNNLSSIKQPTIVFGGEEDEFTPNWMAHEIVEAMPYAELFLYPKSGHIFHFENLEDFNHRSLNWLIKQ